MRLFLCHPNSETPPLPARDAASDYAILAAQAVRPEPTQRAQAAARTVLSVCAHFFIRENKRARDPSLKLLVDPRKASSITKMEKNVKKEFGAPAINRTHHLRAPPTRLLNWYEFVVRPIDHHSAIIPDCRAGVQVICPHS